MSHHLDTLLTPPLHAEKAPAYYSVFVSLCLASFLQVHPCSFNLQKQRANGGYQRLVGGVGKGTGDMLLKVNSQIIGRTNPMNLLHSTVIITIHVAHP